MIQKYREVRIVGFNPRDKNFTGEYNAATIADSAFIDIGELHRTVSTVACRNAEAKIEA